MVFSLSTLLPMPPRSCWSPPAVSGVHGQMILGYPHIRLPDPLRACALSRQSCDRSFFVSGR
ncbi:hypothetical protein [Nitratireductor sp. CH_MIT9313-5]|uniref:hypothetical protein n=1 Tax=Nitratireductor sp. CH_MIT9313-5 TaxID=3107764 RepID=UPI003FA531BD